MNDITQMTDEAIEQMESALQAEKERRKEEKGKRWEPDEDEAAWHPVRRRGNEYRTAEHRDQSTAQAILDGDYEYWIPDSGMWHPDEKPDSCETWDDCYCKWTPSTGSMWHDEFAYRWLKSEYKG